MPKFSLPILAHPASALALLVALAPVAGHAQPAPSAEALREWPQVEMDRPWIYRGSDVPPDTEWTFGELDNGVRYAVRRNEVPQDQLSIRVRIDAGSLHEREDEKGYAHLLEHLLFRESKYLKPGETIPRWQALGATFGNDTNAETTPTQTVYKLDVPNVNDAKVDEVFRLLSGMVTAPVLNKANVRAEVPIVLAERRERGGAARRVAEANLAAYFDGQLLSERPTIGEIETLEAADAKGVSAFYRRWYRPENTVISVAGDVDVPVLEAQLAKWFGKWKAPGETVPAPDFGDPVAAPDAPRADGAMAPVGNLSVIVEPDLPRSIGYAVMRPWEKVADTIEYNEGLLLDQMAQAVINRRLEARARAGGSYLAAQVVQDDVNRSADATFVSINPLGDDWRAALSDVRAVIADALESAPTEAEIAREYAQFETAFAVGVETQEVQQATDLADNIVQAVDIRETVAAPETVLNVLTGMRDEITPERVLDHTRALFSGAVVRGLMVVPDAAEADAAAFRQAMLAPVTPDGSARQPDTQISFADLPQVGEPGSLADAQQTGLLEIESITLSNGVKALIWPNDAEPGRVSVRVRFGNGYGAFGADDASYIELGEAALMGAGIGPLGQDELDRIATGRKMGLNFAVDDDEFVFSGETRAADLRDQLYLFAAKLAMPRWDANPVLRAQAAMEIGYDSYAASPQGVLERELEYWLHGDDPRFETVDGDALDDLDIAGFRDVWEPVLASGPIQVEIFGDFAREDGIAALNETFGALPAREASEPLADLSSFPAPGSRRDLTHRGDPDQAAAVIAWPTGGGRERISMSRQLEVLSQIFNNRLFDAMRERLGASYAPQVNSRWPLDRADGGAILALAQLQPGDIGAFLEESRKIAADLAENGPTEAEIARVTEPLRQLISRAASGNGFWLNQTAGAARDPRRIAQVRTILNDYGFATPQGMQELARLFLVNDKAAVLTVVPEEAGQVIAQGR